MLNTPITAITRDEITDDMPDAEGKVRKMSIATATEEYIAGIAEQGIARPYSWGNILNGAISRFKQMLRNLGIKVSMSDFDIKMLLWESYNKLSRKRVFDAAEVISQ